MPEFPFLLAFDMRWMLICWIWLGISCSSTEAQEDGSDTLLTLTDTIMPSTPPLDTIALPYLLGKFEPAADTSFARLSDAHAGGSAKGGYLHKETYKAFIQMYEAAKADGVELKILSATRNFNYQKGIWERKWKGERIVEGKNLAKEVADPVERARLILRYSSMPGTSRHHWGTDFDVNAFNNGYFSAGKGKREYDWLNAHAASFGFCQPYTPKSEVRPFGYEEEKWHWSYQPLADRYLRSYQILVKSEMIQGFLGDEAAEPLQVIDRYVMGINTVCKKK